MRPSEVVRRFQCVAVLRAAAATGMAAKRTVPLVFLPQRKRERRDVAPPAAPGSPDLVLLNEPTGLTITALPLDILVLIFSPLAMRARLRVLSFVCKRWRTAVLRTITKMKASYYERAAPLLPGITSLSLQGEVAPNYPVPPKLRELSIDMDYGLHKDLAAKFSSVTNLIAINIATTRWTVQREAGLELLLSLRQSITSLSLASHLLSDIAYFPHLEHLSIRRRCIFARNPAADIERVLATHATQLISLSFADEWCATRVLLPALTQLTLAVDEEEPSVSLVADDFPRLVELHLTCRKRWLLRAQASLTALASTVRSVRLTKGIDLHPYATWSEFEELLLRFTNLAHLELVPGEEMWRIAFKPLATAVAALALPTEYLTEPLQRFSRITSLTMTRHLFSDERVHLPCLTTLSFGPFPDDRPFLGDLAIIRAAAPLLRHLTVKFTGHGMLYLEELFAQLRRDERHGRQQVWRISTPLMHGLSVRYDAAAAALKWLDVRITWLR